jgi:Na+-transporting NADH:ubiquinone oxidoreductase subunit NqrC
MTTLTSKILVLSIALSCGALLLASAQTTADQDIKKKEAELDRQKLDLEKKSLELNARNSISKKRNKNCNTRKPAAP